MNWENALGGAIEVSIAIAGFAGIVAAFNRRSEGAWAATDQMLLEMLLASSVAACAFAFLPFVLLDALDDHAAWRIGSGLQVLWLIGITVFRTRQSRRTGAEYFKSARFAAPLGLPAMLLLIGNATMWGTSWPYVVGVLFLIAVGFSAFITLLLGVSGSKVSANE